MEQRSGTHNSVNVEFKYMHGKHLHAWHSLTCMTMLCMPHKHCRPSCAQLRVATVGAPSRLLMDLRMQWVKERSNELGNENEGSIGDHKLCLTATVEMVARCMTRYQDCFTT